MARTLTEDYSMTERMETCGWNRPDIGDLAADEYLMAHAIAARFSPRFAAGLWDDPPRSLSGGAAVSLQRRLIRLIPSLIGARSLLWWSALPIVAGAFVMPAFADELLKASSIVAVMPLWARSAVVGLDPMFFHAFVALVIALVFAYAGREAGAGVLQSLAIGFAAALLIGGVEYVLDSLIIKPAIGIPRPATFDPASEPFFVKALHSVRGPGNDFPSGSVTRQVALACFLMWSCSHPIANMGRWIKLALYSVGWLMVLPVMLQRILSGAHSMESAFVGVSFGILEFWIIAVVFGSIVYGRARELLPDVTRIWVMVMIGWFVLGVNKESVAVMIIAVGLGSEIWQYITAKTVGYIYIRGPRTLSESESPMDFVKRSI